MIKKYFKEKYDNEKMSYYISKYLSIDYGECKKDTILYFILLDLCLKVTLDRWEAWDIIVEVSKEFYPSISKDKYYLDNIKNINKNVINKVSEISGAILDDFEQNEFKFSFHIREEVKKYIYNILLKFNVDNSVLNKIIGELLYEFNKEKYL